MTNNVGIRVMPCRFEQTRGSARGLRAIVYGAIPLHFDMLLGSQPFGPDLALWSLGCVAAELFLREPLFQQNGKELNERCFLDAQFAFVGTHPSSTNEWMTSLPFTENFYGRDARRLPAKAPPEWPPTRMRGCPPQLADFVRQTLLWHHKERLTPASARLHSFVSSRALSVLHVAVAKGQNGRGFIDAGTVDDEVMEYIQTCPTWEQWHAEC